MWVAASVFGIAVGPALGGALTQAFSWRAIFLAQAPLLIPGLLVALRAARAEVVPAAVGRDPDRPSYRLPPRAAVALALLSASLTAVIFLVVLLLVSGWSIEPLAAALAVSVLPISALAASRIRGDAETRAVAGCLLVAGGVGCLALLPGASAWWTVAPQVLAGAGMGMALPGALRRADAGADPSRRLAAALDPPRRDRRSPSPRSRPLISANLTTTVDEAREQGTAAVLDAPLPPENKIQIAPELFGRPRHRRSPRRARVLDRRLARGPRRR